MMEEEKTVYLMTVRHSYEAESIRELMKNNGIYCELRQSGVEGYLELIGWKSPVDLYVSPQRLEEAKELTKCFREDFESGITDEELEEEALAAGNPEETGSN